MQLGRKEKSRRYQLQESWPEVYERAVADAEDDTGLSKSSFPETCPFSLDQILDHEFFPGWPLCYTNQVLPHRPEFRPPSSDATDQRGWTCAGRREGR